MGSQAKARRNNLGGYMTKQEEINELKQMWARQQLAIEKRRAFLEDLSKEPK